MSTGVLENIQAQLGQVLQKVDALEKRLATKERTPVQAASEKDWLTVAEVAEMKGFCEKTVTGWIREGRLRATRKGKSKIYRIGRADADAFEPNDAKPVDEVNTTEQVRRVLSAVSSRVQHG